MTLKIQHYQDDIDKEILEKSGIKMNIEKAKKPVQVRSKTGLEGLLNQYLGRNS